LGRDGVESVQGKNWLGVAFAALMRSGFRRSASPGGVLTELIRRLAKAQTFADAGLSQFAPERHA
jgi:hypothetical protein